MGKLRAAIKHEFLQLLPVWLFFFAAFLVIELYKSLLYTQYVTSVFHFAGFTSAMIGAAIIAKVFLIVDHIPMVERFSGRPLIYVVLWKTALYTIATILLEYLEDGIKLVIKGASVADANRDVLHGLATAHFWAIQIWVVTLYFSFIMFRELFRAISRAIGKQRFHALLFGERVSNRIAKRAA